MGLSTGRGHEQAYHRHNKMTQLRDLPGGDSGCQQNADSE